MTQQAVYIDFDDVLCHTIETLIDELERLHGRRVSRDDVLAFDLLEPFGLSEAELTRFMDRAHEPEVLGAMTAKTDMQATLQDWAKRGHELHVVTGRPAMCSDASQTWLDDHELAIASVQFVDKYGREAAGSGAISLEVLAGQRFDLVVEDSLSMAIFAVEQWDVPIVLMDQPWNRDVDGVDPRVAAKFVRCHDWAEVAARFPLERRR